MLVCSYHTDSGLNIVRTMKPRPRRWLVSLGMKHKDGTVSSTELRPTLPCTLTDMIELACKEMDNMVVDAESPCDKAWFAAHLLRQ